MKHSASLRQRYPVTAPAGAAAQWHLLALEFGFAVRVHAKVTSVGQHTDAGGHPRTDQTWGSVIGDTDRIFVSFAFLLFGRDAVEAGTLAPAGLPGPARDHDTADVARPRTNTETSGAACPPLLPLRPDEYGGASGSAHAGTSLMTSRARQHQQWSRGLSS